jgi:hypothetical protein
MKKVILFTGMALCALTLAFAQSPTGFNFQAVARDADGNALTNQPIIVQAGILSGSEDGELVWQENHEVSTNELGIFNLVICGDNELKSGGSATGVDEIAWASAPHFLSLSVDPGTGSVQLPAQQLMSVPYSLVSSSIVTPLSELSIQPANPVEPGQPLFEVKRKDGYPVFAVYEDGVWVYTDTLESGKGAKGGFAVGGYKRTKGSGDEYMRVTPDSIRFYVNQDQDPSKGSKGGFAVGGYGRKAKGITGDEFLHVSADSVRIYIDNDPQVKGAKGGFAVGGYNRTTKGGLQDFLNVSGQNQVEAIEGENRVIWYPRSNAFLAGNVLILPGDTVGINSMGVGYQVRAHGDYSQAFGYKAISKGNFSTAMGMEAVAYAENSVSLGNKSFAHGDNSFAFGTGAVAMGDFSYSFGSTGLDSAGFPVGGTVAQGDQSFAFGLGSESHGFGSVTLGTLNRAHGEFSTVIGYECFASDGHNTAMGHHSSSMGFLSTAIGSFCTAEGHSSVAIGDRAETFGIHSVALGFACLANEEGAVAIGSDVASTGITSVALGSGCKAQGEASLALGRGTTASGEFATTLGFGTKAAGRASLALGEGIEANGAHSVAIALANLTGMTVERDNTMAIMGGRVGINMLDPDVALQLPNDDNPAVGSAQAYAWETYSDARIKFEQEELDYGLVEVMALQPKQYDHFAADLKEGEVVLKENHTRTIGLVAQDVRTVIPEAVTVPNDESNALWSMDYNKIIPVLVKAIQDQQEIILSQQEQAAIQNDRLTSLEQEIIQLKQNLNAVQ